MASADWYYHRKGWTSCNRASWFLEANGIEVAETVPASRKLQRSDAAELLRYASRLIVARGRKVTEFAGAENADDDAVDAMLGPTGNLRAPTIRTGATVLVGFNEEVYRKVFDTNDW